jgi:hypothetical protein
MTTTDRQVNTSRVGWPASAPDRPIVAYIVLSAARRRREVGFDLAPHQGGGFPTGAGRCLLTGHVNFLRRPFCPEPKTLEETT